MEVAAPRPRLAGRAVVAAAWVWLLCVVLALLAAVAGVHEVAARAVGLGGNDWPPFDGKDALPGNAATVAAASVVLGAAAWLSLRERRVPLAPEWALAAGLLGATAGMAAGMGAGFVAWIAGVALARRRPGLLPARRVVQAAGIGFLLATAVFYARAAADPITLDPTASDPTLEGARLSFSVSNGGPADLRIVGLRPADPRASVRVTGPFEFRLRSYDEPMPALGDPMAPGESTWVYASLRDRACATRATVEVPVLVDFAAGDRRGTSHVVVPVPACGR